jgi:hypothetical protein
MSIVDSAHEAFEQNSPFWTAPLAMTLERARPGCAIEWVLRCATTLLPGSGSPHVAELQVDLANLIAWAHDVSVTAPYRSELAREIWYRPSLAGRDGARTAISHLYGAYDLYLHGDRGYVMALCAPINNFLGDTAWMEMREEGFGVVIKVYHQLLSEFADHSEQGGAH